MSYLFVRWDHSSPTYPVELYSELDETRNEVRKVEIFADGRRHCAGWGGQSGHTRRGEASVPPFDQLATDPEFSPRVITADEFEVVWALSIPSNL